jgi:LytS/YehU family sensor histidine kinase
VSRLADLFRASLANGNAARVPAAQEVETARRYLELERMRFEERLAFEVHVAPEAATRTVPGFLLHSLGRTRCSTGTRWTACCGW